jgi:hypothetical protein
MRELTLIETSYLAGLILLSLVLPLLMSFRGPRDATSRTRCMRTVWLGQGLGAIAALGVVVSATVAPYAAAFGLLSCLCCAMVLVRQTKAAPLTSS